MVGNSDCIYFTPYKLSDVPMQSSALKPATWRDLLDIDAPNKSDIVQERMLEAGGELLINDGNKVLTVVVPQWLKIKLPLTNALRINKRLTDLRMPTDSNPFYLDMKESMGNSPMMQTLSAAATSKDHILLLGSSGKYLQMIKVVKIQYLVL